MSESLVVDGEVPVAKAPEIDFRGLGVVLPVLVENLRDPISEMVKEAVRAAVREELASRDEYMNIGELADKFGVSRPTVSKRLKQAGLVPTMGGKYSVVAVKARTLFVNKAKSPSSFN